MASTTRGQRFAAAGAGVAAAVLGAGLGELTAAFIAPGASPFAVIGSALIDFAPPWAKEIAIQLFGTNDKIALLIGIGIVLVGIAALAGLAELKWPPLGLAIMIAFGGVGVLAAMTRANAGMLDWVPSVVAGVMGAVALGLLMARMPGRAPVSAAPAALVPVAVGAGQAADAEAAASDPPQVQVQSQAIQRRTFLVWTAGTAAVGLLAALGSTLARAGSQAVTVVRDALKLPTPAVAAAAVPATAELDIPGLATVITPNASFYRIDTALIVPQVTPADWSLRIHGMVANEVTITWDELLALPLEESVTTLTCVSNNVGGDLIGNALWLGYPIRELLARAAPTADADMVLSRSIDGFTASSPIEALTDDRNAILAVGMNGEPLPAEHGFPVRMVVPGLYGYVSATKWVTELEVTRFDKATAYWTTRGWSERGPIKLQSRIDVPRRQQGLKAGETVIAGVAWQQHVGVAGVEVQLDEGEWQQATLATSISDDTWVQWSLAWTATEGDHLIRCRATSRTGEVQTQEVSRTDPDGATGWHERFITVFA
ncbi:DMSO/TMAO reductase YedYZ, molybdopterin-dependent catalytic subunit [Microbacterium sp. cf046]|uniref:molybdopterin-dependent oxidoreductase n=1 Tax=Microbacterium sp. cf046 TaxID=1761803 RepID=UPI0008E6FC8D|nr:molybdopterin-dependent oxidoreductase [Microbacterium sp. cf046]SFS13590.1 DMSO/TMAO reductase YedYZ, molybdopterin-dependent catalytic subunit [Microbacterium sp. cf046]